MVAGLIQLQPICLWHQVFFDLIQESIVRAASRWIFCFILAFHSGSFVLGQKAFLPNENVKANSSKRNSEKSDADVRALIEQLAYSDEPAPDFRKLPIQNPGQNDDPETRGNKYAVIRNAFKELTELREVGIPFLVEHLNDNRQSLPFHKNTGSSVGDACYWNIYYQLQDTPRDYSEYGLSRKGRDGNDHTKPYWESTPFEGGLTEWLEKNKDLSYVQKQIKCLQWLLDREKSIGVPDAKSYYINILPLEIQLMQRRLENGELVQAELQRLIEIRDKKLDNEIPLDLLPERRSNDGPPFVDEKLKSIQDYLKPLRMSNEELEALCEAATASIFIHFDQDIQWYDRESKTWAKLKDIESIRNRLTSVPNKSGIQVTLGKAASNTDDEIKSIVELAQKLEFKYVIVTVAHGSISNLVKELYQFKD